MRKQALLCIVGAGFGCGARRHGARSQTSAGRYLVLDHTSHVPDRTTARVVIALGRRFLQLQDFWIEWSMRLGRGSHLTNIWTTVIIVRTGADSSIESCVSVRWRTQGKENNISLSTLAQTSNHVGVAHFGTSLRHVWCDMCPYWGQLLRSNRYGWELGVSLHGRLAKASSTSHLSILVSYLANDDMS